MEQATRELSHVWSISGPDQRFFRARHNQSAYHRRRYARHGCDFDSLGRSELVVDAGSGAGSGLVAASLARLARLAPFCTPCTLCTHCTPCTPCTHCMHCTRAPSRQRGSALRPVERCPRGCGDPLGCTRKSLKPQATEARMSRSARLATRRTHLRSDAREQLQ